jgi:hypothetical protein
MSIPAGAATRIRMLETKHSNDGALAPIGDRPEDTQNKADMRPVTCAIGMAVGRSESAGVSASS